jgi:hypothetical protein
MNETGRNGACGDRRKAARKGGASEASICAAFAGSVSVR